MNKALTYDQYGNLNSQQLFLEKYSVLVKRIAHHLIGRLPPSVLIEDLIQAGMVGLLEAQKIMMEVKARALKPMPEFGFVGLCSTISDVVTGFRDLCTNIIGKSVKRLQCSRENSIAIQRMLKWRSF